MIRRVLLFVALAFASLPAFAQTTYSTPLGGRAQGVVDLVCDVNNANCAPGQPNAVYWLESTTPLGVNGVLTTTARDSGPAGSPTSWNKFSCYFKSDQATAAGGFATQGSTDGVTWFTDNAPLSAAANIAVTQETRTYFRYHRCIVVNNGTSAQTTLVVASQFGL